MWTRRVFLVRSFRLKRHEIRTCYGLKLDILIIVIGADDKKL